jgi:uncharacterized membrane protein YeaQ/YmgE (transglycosylase-associated protein family)
MSADTPGLDPLIVPLAVEAAPVAAPVLTPDQESDPSSQGTALAAVSPAEQRVQLAKERLTQHLHALDRRARFVAKQSAWLAGALVLGLVGAAVAGSLLGRAISGGARQRSRSTRRPGVGSALMLAALGLISRRVGR